MKPTIDERPIAGDTKIEALIVPDADIAERPAARGEAIPDSNAFGRLQSFDSMVERADIEAIGKTKDLVLFDISDLIYYIGHHPNLTGIQRVQAKIVAAAETDRNTAIHFITWNTKAKCFQQLDDRFIHALLNDLIAPKAVRTVEFDHMLARLGILPGSEPLNVRRGVYDQVSIVLLGSGWVLNDYFYRINRLKRDLGAEFCMILHDLIPIFARETCDQGTARVFESFLLKSPSIVDTYICVSENTRKDLLRHCKEVGYAEPNAVVIKHGSEVSLQTSEPLADAQSSDPFVLFVSTIEGRKNHILALKTWKRLIHENSNTPKLVCVGRYGWRSEEFIRTVVSTRGLDNKIQILSDISDEELEDLYSNCLFTIYPSFYEGWGLPVTESLARGKVCICSHASALPEAGGDLAIYIDPHSADHLYEATRDLLDNPDVRREREKLIRERFTVRPWSEVAKEYIDVATRHRNLPIRRLYMSPAAGREYVLKKLDVNFDDRVGEELFRAIEAIHEGPILSQPVTTQQYYEGLNLRGAGQWMEAEDWGTWLGLGGGSLDFWWDYDPDDVLCAILGEVLPGFEGTEVRYSLNGYKCERRRYNKSTRQFLDVLRLHPKPELNRLFIDMNLNDAQRAMSLERDGRGLMVGFTSVAFIPQSDIETRVLLLEKALEFVGSGRA